MRRELYYLLVRGLLWVIGVVPRGVALGLCGALGRLAGRLFARDRARVDRHLELAFPGLEVAARRRLRRRSFVELGRNAADIARMLRHDALELRELLVVEGEPNLRRACAGGRGVVVVTGHFGAWELLGAAYVQLGWRVYAVARPLKDPRYQRLIGRLRQRLGIEVVLEGRGLRPLVRAIRRGAIVGILFDQARDARGMWVEFFGRPAYTPVGPVELARLAGAALLPASICRSGRGHVVRIDEPIELDWRRPGATREALGRCNAVLEGWIRRDPAQWVWMYDRWRGPRGGCS